MENVPNQFLSDVMAGKIDVNGKSLVKETKEEAKEEIKPLAKVEKPIAKAKKK